MLVVSQVLVVLDQENGDVEGVQAALRLGAPVNATNESLDGAACGYQIVMIHSVYLKDN